MTVAQSLVPIEQRDVQFYEDTVVAVRLEDGTVFVPIKPVCDLLGVDWGGQYRRIQRDPVLSEEVRRVDVTSMRRGTQPMVCLPLDYISGFLFGLNADRVKPELRERVILYQKECYKVLSEAFQEGRLTADLSFEKLLHQNTEAVRAYQMLQAMVKLARSQILIEVKLERMDNRLDAHDKRLEDLEVYLVDPERKITEAQVIEISQAIKAIAEEAEKHSSKKEYGRVYEDMYDLFGISSYRQLPAREFDRMMAWLTERYQQLSGRYDDTPF